MKEYDVCGAKTRSGGTCQKPAGWGTDHAGVGRCRLHGGKSPIKHGRYSSVRGVLAEKMAKHAADTDPIDLIPELSMLRALLEGWLEKNTDTIETAIPGIMALIGDIRKIVDTIHKIQTREILTMTEVTIVLSTLAAILREEVTDESTLADIIRKLRSRLQVPRLTGGEDILGE